MSCQGFGSDPSPGVSSPPRDTQDGEALIAGAAISQSRVARK